MLLAYTSNNILIFLVDRNFVKGVLKVIDYIVLNAEYWCPDGTRDCMEMKKD